MHGLTKTLCYMLLLTSSAYVFGGYSRSEGAPDRSIAARGVEIDAEFSQWDYSIAQQSVAGQPKNSWFIAKAEESKSKRWDELTPKQRRKIKKRHKQYEALPPSEQERIKKARREYRELSPEKREKLRQQWESMTPEERRKKAKKARDKR